MCNHFSIKTKQSLLSKNLKIVGAGCRLSEMPVYRHFEQPAFQFKVKLNRDQLDHKHSSTKILYELRPVHVSKPTLCAERPTTPEPQFSTPVFSTCTCSAVLLQQGSNKTTSADRCQGEWPWNCLWNWCRIWRKSWTQHFPARHNR